MNVIQTAATPIIRLERPPELPVPEVKDFFWSVHRAGLEFLDVIKPIDAPDPVRHAEHEVFPLLRSRITNFLPNMPDLEYKLVLKDDLWGLPSGLNSLGWLIDRLAVLTIRYWQFDRRHKDPLKAEETAARDIADVINVISTSLPGSELKETKVTKFDFSRSFGSFSEALLTLLTVNFTTWEMQHLTYLGKGEDAPLETFKRYAELGMELNLRRLDSLSQAHNRYWLEATGRTTFVAKQS